MKLIKLSIILLATGFMVLQFGEAIEDNNPLNLKLEKLSSEKMACSVGSWGFGQECPSTTNGSCPGEASCSGVTCTQWILNGFPTSCITAGGSTGCTSSGSYKKCVWKWCLWCSGGGAGACGSPRRPLCNEACFQCLGGCTLTTFGGNCRTNCT